MNIPTTDYPALIEIINQTYTSGLDAILAAKMVGKNKMLVLGQDGSKQLAIELSPKNIAIKWINSGQKPPKKGAESFGESSLDDALLNAAVVSMAQLVGIDLPVSFGEAPILDLDEEYAEGKAFKCSPKSISCKGRCISGWKVCRDGLIPAQVAQLNQALQSIKKAKSAGAVDEKAEGTLKFYQGSAAKLQQMKSEPGGENATYFKASIAYLKEREAKKQKEMDEAEGPDEKPILAADDDIDLKVPGKKAIDSTLKTP
jgi:hypothetical protein